MCCTKRRGNGGGIFPVEREAGRMLEKEFEAVMARLTARIETWPRVMWLRSRR